VQVFKRKEGARIGRDNTIISICEHEKCCNPKHLIIVPKAHKDVRTIVRGVLAGHPELLPEFQQRYDAILVSPDNTEIITGKEKAQIVLSYLGRNYPQLASMLEDYKEQLKSLSIAWNYNVQEETINLLAQAMLLENCPKNMLDLTAYRLLKSLQLFPRTKGEMIVHDNTPMGMSYEDVRQLRKNAKESDFMTEEEIDAIIEEEEREISTIESNQPAQANPPVEKQAAPAVVEAKEKEKVTKAEMPNIEGGNFSDCMAKDSCIGCKQAQQCGPNGIMEMIKLRASRNADKDVPEDDDDDLYMY
jgi:hypothetical protein